MSNNVVKTEYGYEVTWAETDNYVSKLLVFEQAFKTSIHYYKHKDRSWFINNGNFRIRWIDVKDGKLYQQDVTEGATFHSPATMPVSLECLGSGGSISETGNNPKNNEQCILIPSNNIGV